MCSHMAFEIRIDFELGRADEALKWRVSGVSSQMDHQLTRVSRRVRTNHAFEGPIVRVSPHVFFHGAALTTRVVAELTSERLVAGMNALMYFEFIDAIKGLFTLAAYKRFFARVHQKMALQVFGVFRNVVATWRNCKKGERGIHTFIKSIVRN